MIYLFWARSICPDHFTWRNTYSNLLGKCMTRVILLLHNNSLGNKNIVPVTLSDDENNSKQSCSRLLSHFPSNTQKVALHYWMNQHFWFNDTLIKMNSAINQNVSMNTNNSMIHSLRPSLVTTYWCYIVTHRKSHWI